MTDRRPTRAATPMGLFDILRRSSAEGTEAGLSKKRVGLSRWVERRAQRVAKSVYETQADDLEERARRVVGSAYKDHSDDLEERAVRAMRRAIIEESQRIKDVIEYSIQIKKREVRWSLLVLVVASLVYLGLYWFTRGGGGAAE